MRLINADIGVGAPNVTLRRVELQGGVINNDIGACGNGLKIEDSTILPAPGQDYGNDSEGVISYGGYTADGVKIWHRSEGFRAVVQRRLRPNHGQELLCARHPPAARAGTGTATACRATTADAITVRNVTLELDIAGCGGTAPVLRPLGPGQHQRRRRSPAGQGRRLSVPPRGPGNGDRAEDRQWLVGVRPGRRPLLGQLSDWEAEIVALSADYRITDHLRSQRCEGSG